MINIKQLNSSDSDFQQSLDALLAWESVSDAAVADTVKEILAAVKANGDKAVIDYSCRFDRLDVKTMEELEIPLSRAQQALDHIGAEGLFIMNMMSANVSIQSAALRDAIAQGVSINKIEFGSFLS